MGKKTLLERFEARYTPEPTTGCWLWVGVCDKWGYGFLYDKGSHLLAHRVSYKLHIGPIPTNMLICHKCDVCSCVNPSHLFAGTNLDNALDKVSKGRVPRGQSHWNSKVSVADVELMKEMRSQGGLLKEIGLHFNISEQYVGRLLKGKHSPS